MTEITYLEKDCPIGNPFCLLPQNADEEKGHYRLLKPFDNSM
jgi:hypothetical protein